MAMPAGDPRTARSVGLSRSASFAEPNDSNDRQAPATPRSVVTAALSTAATRPTVQLRRTSPARRICAGSPRTHRHLLADPRKTTERLAQAIVEVLAGIRPVTQLASVASLDVLRFLARNTGRLGGRPGTPVQRPTVASLRICEPCDGVIEASAVIDTGMRRRALALRLEGIDGQWRCIAINLG